MRTLSFIFLTLLSGRCLGLSLGEVVITSHLNEPLAAEISIEKAGEINASSCQVSVADKESYQSASIEPPIWINKLQLKVIADNNKKPFISLSTPDPISDLYAHVLIQLITPETTLTKHITLLLEPKNLQLVAAVKPAIQTKLNNVTQEKEEQKKILTKLVALEKKVNSLSEVNQDISHQYETLKIQHEQLMQKMAHQGAVKQESAVVVSYESRRDGLEQSTYQNSFLNPKVFIDLMQNNTFSLTLHFIKSQTSRSK